SPRVAPVGTVVEQLNVPAPADVQLVGLVTNVVPPEPSHLIVIGRLAPKALPATVKVDPAPPVAGVSVIEALTVMLGEAARLVRVPPAVDFSWACQLWAPPVEVAVAPGPPEPLAP